MKIVMKTEQEIQLIVRPTTSRLDRWTWEVQTRLVKTNPGNPLRTVAGTWKTVVIPQIYISEFKANEYYKLIGFALTEQSALITGREQARKWKDMQAQRAGEAERINEHTIVESI